MAAERPWTMAWLQLPLSIRERCSGPYVPARRTGCYNSRSPSEEERPTAALPMALPRSRYNSRSPSKGERLIARPLCHPSTSYNSRSPSEERATHQQHVIRVAAVVVTTPALPQRKSDDTRRALLDELGELQLPLFLRGKSNVGARRHGLPSICHYNSRSSSEEERREPGLIYG